MEKTEKNNFLIFLNIKAPQQCGAFFLPLFYAYPVIHCNPLPRLASGYKGFVAIRARELVVETALTFINYILQQGLMSVRRQVL
jgi:hypothetical protein